MVKRKTPTPNRWYRHLFHRKEVLKTTWKLRLLVILVLISSVVLPRRFWAKEIGQSLVCSEQADHSDALLLENFDIHYLVFERAAALEKVGLAPRAFVPTSMSRNSSAPNEVSRRFVEVMVSMSGLKQYEIIPIREIEPISLNAAKQILDSLNEEHIKSVVVLSPGFRSRRSEMVYKAVLEPAGIRVGCVAVFGGNETLGNWADTWHGIQNTVEQFFKLQYYRFYVLL